LQPFHEYECTGSKDDHVTRIDMTDELIKEFKEGQNVYVSIGVEY
jgi:hypothetical protein